MVSAQLISFGVRGMSCPKCAGPIERALVQLDGVIAAQVNYATEHAQVIHDPSRITASNLVSALRHNGYDTLVEHLTWHSDDLLYATAQRPVGRALGRIEGVADLSVDLAGCTVRLAVCHAMLGGPT